MLSPQWETASQRPVLERFTYFEMGPTAITRTIRSAFVSTIATAEGRAARTTDDAVPARRGADRAAEIDPVPLTRWVAFVGALEPLRHAHLLAAREVLLLGTVDSTAAVNALGRGVANLRPVRCRPV